MLLVNGFINASSVARPTVPRVIRRLSIHTVGNAFVETLAIPSAPPDILYWGISGIVKLRKMMILLPRAKEIF